MMRRMFFEPRLWCAAVLGIGLAVVPACGSQPKARAEGPAAVCPRSSLPKVDPQLLCLMERREDSERSGHPIAASPDAPIDVEVAIKGEVAPITAAGFPLHSLVPDSARGGLSPAQIRALVARDDVLFVQIPVPKNIEGVTRSN